MPMRGWGLPPSSKDKWIAEPSVGVGINPTPLESFGLGAENVT